MEKQTIIITNVPEDYIKIASGVGSRVPRDILVAPFVYENEVLGVIELGSLSKFTEIQLKFIKQISSSIAITIHSAQVRLEMKELLHKTMEQSEELQSQQEELRQNNEELEEHTKSLKKSEAILRGQQEELCVVNEELSFDSNMDDRNIIDSFQKFILIIEDDKNFVMDLLVFQTGDNLISI